MSLPTVQAMRDKYAPRTKHRRAPGGADVIALCELADRLETLVRDCQHKLPTDQQNIIERNLWSIDAKP